MTTAAAEPTRSMYRISPLDNTGVFLGLSLAQLVVGCAAALGGALVIVFLSVPLGIALTVMGAALALVRLTGEPILHQLPNVARTLRQGSKANTWFRPIPLLGPTTDPKQLPPPLARQELLAVDPSVYGVELDGPVAIVREQAAGLYAISLRIAGRQFGLLEPHEQDYQLAQWSKVLHGFVAERPAIASIRWTEWAAPAGIDEQRTWLDRHIATQHLPDVLASYQTLLATLADTATRHEVIVTITTNPSRVRLQKRHKGNRHHAIIETLLTETRTLIGRLDSAELTARVLDPNEWARAMRLRLDPDSRQILARRARTLGNTEQRVTNIDHDYTHQHANRRCRAPFVLGDGMAAARRARRLAHTATRLRDPHEGRDLVL
jgi:hypothetical protein